MRLMPLALLCTACSGPLVEAEATRTVSTVEDGLVATASLSGRLSANGAARDALDTFTVRALADGEGLDEGVTVTLYAGVGQGRTKITFGRSRSGGAEAEWTPVDLQGCSETGGVEADGACTIAFELVVETPAPETVDVALSLEGDGKVKRKDRDALAVGTSLDDVDTDDG